MNPYLKRKIEQKAVEILGKWFLAEEGLKGQFQRLGEFNTVMGKVKI